MLTRSIPASNAMSEGPNQPGPTAAPKGSGCRAIFHGRLLQQLPKLLLHGIDLHVDCCHQGHLGFSVKAEGPV